PGANAPPPSLTVTFSPEAPPRTAMRRATFTVAVPQATPPTMMRPLDPASAAPPAALTETTPVEASNAHVAACAVPALASPREVVTARRTLRRQIAHAPER